jgi:F-type H+-transporting ATPase subunit beta
MMPVGVECLGRILNVIGEPVDEAGPVNAKKLFPIHREPPKFVDQSTKVEIFETGIKVIDLLAPYRRAARSASSAAPASARPCSSRSSSTTSPRPTAACRVRRRRRAHPRGQRPLPRDDRVQARDGRARHLEDRAHLRPDERAPGARARVALSALTVAEYFRDERGQDVLLFVDNIFRFTQAGSEVSALLGRIPSAVGYQPTLSTEMGALQERITSTKKGSITSVQAIYVPADDLTDPAPATTFAHLDATTVLSAPSPSSASTPRWTRSTRPRRMLDPQSSASGTTRSPAACSRRCRSTRICRTSSPSSAWTSSPKTTSRRQPRPQASSASSRSPSSWPRSSRASRAAS